MRPKYKIIMFDESGKKILKAAAEEASDALDEAFSWKRKFK